jgi:YfiH family protein
VANIGIPDFSIDNWFKTTYNNNAKYNKMVKNSNNSKTRMKLQRKKFKGRFINIYETPQIIMGFTEIHFSLSLLSRLFNTYKLIELKQVHSDIIRVSSQIEPGTEGDGIILDQTDTMAVIKTADCTPLFFWYHGSTDSSIGGVVHIGWRGLLKGIEKKLLKMLAEKFTSVNIRQLNVFLGPAIEKSCYPVGPDIYDMFSSKTYRDDIFYPLYTSRNKKCKYLLDVKKGIRLSLRESGIPDQRIWESLLCTFCEKDRFPSHRRCPTPGKRIYNFLLLKSLSQGNRVWL